MIKVLCIILIESISHYNKLRKDVEVEGYQVNMHKIYAATKSSNESNIHFPCVLMTQKHRAWVAKSTMIFANLPRRNVEVMS